MKRLIAVAAAIGIVGALAGASPAMARGARGEPQVFEIAPGADRYAIVLFRPYGDVLQVHSRRGGPASVTVQQSGATHSSSKLYTLAAKGNGTGTYFAQVNKKTSGKHDLKENSIHLLIFKFSGVTERHLLFNYND